jgi:hypothetical protein
MDPQERYLADPHFHRLVDLLVLEFRQSVNSGAGFTPSEIREAAGLAWQIYMERHVQPSIRLESH